MTAALSNDEIEDRYFLLSRVEIKTLINELAHRREPVTVYFNGGSDFILTVFLAANDDGIVFDLGGDEASNRRLEKSASCVCLSLPDGIRIQFTGQKPQRFIWGDQAAFWVPLPERIIRLQRRESYRHILPITKAMNASLYDHEAKLLGKYVVHDLSVGGCGLSAVGQPELRIDQQIAQVSFALGQTLIHSPASVRHVTMVERRLNPLYRVGLRFINLSHKHEVAIQKYILLLEHERRKLL